MGCDIHVFPEVCDVTETGEREYWDCACDVFRLGRDYGLFEIMAGVRGDDALYQPRGVPPRISLWAKRKNELVVVDGERDGDGTCTRESAERWGGRYTDERKQCVYHPDWHSHSWLTVDELQKCAIEYVKRFGREPSEHLYALIAMLLEYEEHGKKTRIVFWFDN